MDEQINRARRSPNLYSVFLHLIYLRAPTPSRFSVNKLVHKSMPGSDKKMTPIEISQGTIVLVSLFHFITYLLHSLRGICHCSRNSYRAHERCDPSVCQPSRNAWTLAALPVSSGSWRVYFRLHHCRSVQSIRSSGPSDRRNSFFPTHLEWKIDRTLSIYPGLDSSNAYFTRNQRPRGGTNVCAWCPKHDSNR